MSLRCGRKPPFGRIHSAAVAVLIGLAWLAARADAITQTCSGDCDQRGEVSVDELVTLVGVALGTQALDACGSGDADDDGRITVDEIIAATRRALGGCPSSQVCGNQLVDAEEECDDGGVCIGGSLAGTACGSEAECTSGGACFGGLDDLRACTDDDDCRQGHCVRCRPVGGDGCAANCTLERDVLIDFVPGILDSSDRTRPVAIVPGTSGLGLVSSIVHLSLPISGSMSLRVGGIVGEQAPVVIRAGSLAVDPLAVAGVSCSCLRAPELSTCGGTTFDHDGSPSPVCTAGLPGATECAAELPCAPVHGAGNSGSGFVTCGGRGLSTEVIQDCNSQPGVPGFPAAYSTSASDTFALPTVGNAALTLTTALDSVIGSCSGAAADYGPDGELCTEDDPLPARGVPLSLVFTTGGSAATILNPADFPGDINGPNAVDGTPFLCREDTLDFGGGALTASFTECDRPTLADVAVPIVLSFGPERTPESD